MPKVDLTRTRRIRVNTGGVIQEVRRMKTADIFWNRPVAPDQPPVTGYINPPPEDAEND